MNDFLDPEVVEIMLEECLQRVEEDEDFFNGWEIEFLESIECQIEEKPVTEKQLDKLEQIHRKLQ